MSIDFRNCWEIGIDESTAIVVRGSRAEVIGENDVYSFDASLSSAGGRLLKRSEGEVYELQKRAATEMAKSE